MNDQLYQKLNSKVNKINETELSNIIVNGDGSNGFTGWSAPSGGGNIDGWISRDIPSIGSGVSTIIQDLAGKIIDGHTYYTRLQYKIDSVDTFESCYYGLHNSIAGNSTISFGAIEIGEIKEKSLVFTPSLVDVRFAAYFRFTNAVGRAIFGIRYVTLIDLTSTFGAGNEPSKEDMDELIAIFPNKWIGRNAELREVQSSILNNYLNLKQRTIYPFKFTDELTSSYDISDIEIPADPVNALTSEVYAQYDGLVTLFPNYITKTLLGVDSLSNNIYQYSFLPHILDSVQPLNNPKIIIITSAHGDEKAAAYSTYNMFKKICSNWQDNKLLEFLRFNVDFIVVPVLNPSGFDANTRANSNLVDLNRNYPSKWSKATPSSGVTPVSELETQIVINLINSNLDADYLIDYHNMSFRDGYMGYVLTSEKAVNEIANRTLNTMGRNWQQRYPLFPQEEDHLFGYTDFSGNFGTLTNYTEERGLAGCTLESVREIQWQDVWSRSDELTVASGAELLISFCKGLLRDLA